MLPLLLLGMFSSCLLLRSSVEGLLSRRASPGRTDARLVGPAERLTPDPVTAVATNIAPTSVWQRARESNTVSVTTLPPAPPRGLTVRPAVGGGVSVQWEDTEDETSYSVERSVGGERWEVIGALSRDRATYTDHDLRSGSTHYYRVSAASRCGHSDYSHVVSITPALDRAPSAAASLEGGKLQAAAVSGTAIKLRWARLASAKSYTVERSTDGDAWRVVARLAAGDTSYTDTGLRPSTTYYYRVRVT
ncbi:MAG: fibronectin type III domain-containing protein [Chloroflexota bacterium]|nr:fibronectin type III domain-containing protein [Chloroflexota bacterium]